MKNVKLSSRAKRSFVVGAVAGVALVSFVVNSMATASVPSRGQITDDTALYQNLSEIRVPKERPVNFEKDIAKLSMLENRYRERLPSRPDPVAAPMKRISQRKYQFSNPAPLRAKRVQRVGSQASSQELLD